MTAVDCFCDWKPMTSDVLLGMVMFIILLNKLVINVGDLNFMIN